MGIIILLIAIVVEITFAVSCIITKSNQPKIRSIIRIIAFIVFVLFSTLSVINWSFRYYTLATFLLLLAIIGTVGLIKNKKEKRAYKKASVMMKTIGMLMIIFVVTLPSIIFPQYNQIQPIGKFQVTTIKYTYTDTKRIETYINNGENRKLNVEMWYPQNTQGKYPLVVFSHGAFGVKTSNETLFNELASHGYVVCSIDHTYQSLYTIGNDGHMIFVNKGFMKELQSENVHLNKQQSYDHYQKWMKIRTDDINFVVDYIL